MTVSPAFCRFRAEWHAMACPREMLCSSGTDSGVSAGLAAPANVLSGGVGYVHVSSPCRLIAPQKEVDMRRADRLFEIIQLLRRKPTVKARELADALEVSERTIYRDVRDL